MIRVFFSCRKVENVSDYVIACSVLDHYFHNDLASVHVTWICHVAWNALLLWRTRQPPCHSPRADSICSAPLYPPSSNSQSSENASHLAPARVSSSRTADGDTHCLGRGHLQLLQEKMRYILSYLRSATYQ